ncbi:16460_t:CDS:2, partial [Racocetra persica]
QNLYSNIKSSNRVNGITVFISTGYSPILVQNSENVNSKDMIKELSRLNIKILAYILNIAENAPYNEKIAKKPPNSFMIFQSQICHMVKAKYSHLNNHQVSSFIGYLWSKLSPELREDFISKELSERNIYKIKKNYYEKPNERNNAEKTYSEESSEINNAQKTYFQESNKINNNQKTYSKENKESTENLENPSMYAEESTEKFENPSAIKYITKKLESPSEMIDGEKSTEKLVDSVLMGMLSTENIENPLILINGGQSSRKLANLDSESLNFESLMSLIT